MNQKIKMTGLKIRTCKAREGGRAEDRTKRQVKKVERGKGEVRWAMKRQ